MTSRGLLIRGTLLPVLAAGFLNAEVPKAPPAPKFMVQLIHAQNEKIEDDPTIEPDLRKKLVTLFGYDRYHRISRTVTSIQDAPPATATATPEMFEMRMSRVSQDMGTYQLELMQLGTPVFKGQVKPKPLVPIIIRGPFYDKGNLIMVIREEREAE